MDMVTSYADVFLMHVLGLFETSGLGFVFGFAGSSQILCNHSEAAFKTAYSEPYLETKFVLGSLNRDGNNVCRSWLSESIFVTTVMAERIYEVLEGT